MHHQAFLFTVSVDFACCFAAHSFLTAVLLKQSVCLALIFIDLGIFFDEDFCSAELKKRFKGLWAIVKGTEREHLKFAMAGNL